MWVRPRAIPARSAAISFPLCRPSAICHVPCPTIGTRSGIGPKRRLISPMRYIGSMAIESVNPATGRQLRGFEPPALAAGNVGLLKHASNVPQCALALEDLFARAGAPAGVFQTLLVGSERVGAIIGDERVAAVTVTGSEGAGREIASTAGRHI